MNRIQLALCILSLALSRADGARSRLLCAEAVESFDRPSMSGPLADPGPGGRRLVAVVVARYDGREVVVFAPYGPQQHIEAVRLLSAKHLNPFLQRQNLPEMRVEKNPTTGEMTLQGFDRGHAIAPGPGRVEFLLMGEAEVISENGEGRISRLSNVSGLGKTLMNHHAGFKNDVSSAIPGLQRAGLLASNFMPITFDPKITAPQHLDPRLNELTTRDALHLFPNLLLRITANGEHVADGLKRNNSVPDEEWDMLWRQGRRRDGNDATIDVLVPTLEVFAENGLISKTRAERVIGFLNRLKARERLSLTEVDLLVKSIYELKEESDRSRDQYEVLELKPATPE